MTWLEIEGMGKLHLNFVLNDPNLEYKTSKFGEHFK